MVVPKIFASPEREPERDGRGGVLLPRDGGGVRGLVHAGVHYQVPGVAHQGDHRGSSRGGLDKWGHQNKIASRGINTILNISLLPQRNYVLFSTSGFHKI